MKARRIPSPALSLLCLATCFASAGCGAQEAFLAADGTTLFIGRDGLGVPGRETDLQAQVRGGDFLRGRPGLAVRFYRGGELYKVAETDANGVATVAFTPPAEGDYLFQAAVAPAGMAGDLPQPAPLLLACRKPDTPLAIVDLDKTIVASGFEAVLAGNPQPMAGSQGVLARLARTHTVVYLTHRPDFFTRKSRDWLREQQYPIGPLLLSTRSQFLSGSGRYKAAAIAHLQRDFGRVEIGIGDKISDARAYHESGMKAILIYHVSASAEPARRQREAKELESLPAEVQVVSNWAEVADALAGKRVDARRRIVEELRSKVEPGSARGAAQ